MPRLQIPPPQYPKPAWMNPAAMSGPPSMNTPQQQPTIGGPDLYGTMTPPAPGMGVPPPISTMPMPGAAPSHFARLTPEGKPVRPEDRPKLGRRWGGSIGRPAPMDDGMGVMMESPTRAY